MLFKLFFKARPHPFNLCNHSYFQFIYNKKGTRTGCLS